MASRTRIPTQQAGNVVDRIAVGFSHVGRGGLVWFAIALWVGRGERDVKPAQARGVSLAAIGFAYLLSTGLARVVGRARPCRQGRRSLIPCPEGGSFPSDQAAAAFAAAGILGWLDPPGRPWLGSAAVCVGASRVVVGVHHVTDILGGAVLGAALSGLGQMELRRRLQDPR
jgi:membrane-associated phospholipid phosphatase